MERFVIFTTIGQNCGDDFIREGLLSFLQKGHQIKLINKHDLKTFTDDEGDKIKWADKIILAGTPFFWCLPNNHCGSNSWTKPLWHDGIFKVSTPTYNMGAGSCQSYNSTGKEFCSACFEFAKKTAQRCSITIVRDRLAQDLLKRIGLKVECLPCPALFLADRYGLANDPQLLLFNFMSIGAHEVYEPGFNKQRWWAQLKRLIQHLEAKTLRYLAICHNQKEVQFAQSFIDKKKIFFSNNYHDYPAVYAKGRLGIFNRLHGAFALASFGQPVAGIGGDTRTRMLDEIGQPRYFVNRVPDLVEILENLEERSVELRQQLFAKKEYARTRYAAIVQSIEEE